LLSDNKKNGNKKQQERTAVDASREHCHHPRLLCKISYLLAIPLDSQSSPIERRKIPSKGEREEGPTMDALALDRRHRAAASKHSCILRNQQQQKRPRIGVSVNNWGGSAVISYGQAGIHFNKFFASAPLAEFSKDYRVKLFGGVDAAETLDNIQLKHVKVRVMDHYADYLTTATHTHDDSKLLSYSSADRYLSAVKMGINRRALQQEIATPLTPESMRHVRSGMVKKFVARAINNNTSLTKSHVTSKPEDLKTVCILCIWQNTFAMADMFFFFLSLRYVCMICTGAGADTFENHG
jgi:hypothetical protein